MIKTNLVILMFVFQLGLFTSILIETGKKDKYCFYKKLFSGDTLQMSYIISGENDEKINAIIMNEKNKIIWHNLKSDHGDYKEIVKNEGVHHLCFIPTDVAHSFYITFEFFSLFEKGHILDMAQDKNLHDMKTDVSDIGLMFEEMEKNVKFIMDRRNKHADIINEIGDSIRHISYLKIIVVTLVSLLQVLLIHKLFGGNKKNPSFRISGSSELYDMGVNNI